MLHMSEIACVSIKVQQAQVFDSYDIDRDIGSFNVIDEATNNTVAAGKFV